METHICPTCSQECIYKNGIMCTIQGCVKDGSQPPEDNINDIFNNPMNNNSMVNTLKSIFGIK